LSVDRYTMTISRTTVDKLGIKLYDKAAAVVAELIANSYDADAENVTVKMPLNKWLATVTRGGVVDQGFEIVVEDDGCGMTPDVINEFYLRVGTNPRIDSRRGPLSLEKKRPRMGRKGIGKLAPFGICEVIEVRSAGGEKTPEGYKTAHFIMNFDEISQETDAPYHPDLGDDDGAYSQKRGTTITLRNFLPRRTPDEDTFHRQIARAFGLQLPDFRIEVENTVNGKRFVIGQLEVEIEEATKIDVSDRPVVMDDGVVLPVSGWVAYTRTPYKNEEVAGVRIYTRGKIVSTTKDFSLKAGFTGEHTLRSYLAGIIHADWIDEDDDEDLIHTGRQDILWDSEKGVTFRKWGQELLKELGTKSRTPMRQKAWRVFLESSNLEAEAEERFEDARVVEATMAVGKFIGQTVSLGDLQDAEYVRGLKELVLSIAPHKMLVDKLKEVGEIEVERPLDAVAMIFNDAKVAETASLGQVAMERVRAITKLEDSLRSQPVVDEGVLQKLIEAAPWLINPQWTVLQTNRTFETLRSRFESWYFDKNGRKISTTTLKDGRETKPDFIMMHVGRSVEIVEIKRPKHALGDEEFERLRGYIDTLDEFMKVNPTLKKEFPEVHATLICDELKLERTTQLAFDQLRDRGRLEMKTWDDTLVDAVKANEDFLAARSRK